MEDEFRVSLDDQTVRRELPQLLEECQDVWSGRLGTIDVAKHRIEMTPGAKRIYQAP